MFSQPDVADYLYDQANHQTVHTYQFDDRYEHLILNSGFSKGEIEQIPFTDRRILKIDLVYSRFRESQEFDQRQLDLERIRGLIEINPEITINKFFDWNIIGQTGCSSSVTCTGFFHGFVIYYEEYFTKENSLLEIDSIKTQLVELDQQIIELNELLTVDFKRIDCLYPESLYSMEKVSEEIAKYYTCGEEFKGRVFFDVFLDYKGRILDVSVRGNLFPCKDKLRDVLKHVLQWKRGLVIGRKQYDIKASGFVSFPLRKESVAISSFEIPEGLIKEFKMLPTYPECVAYESDTAFTDLFTEVDKEAVSTTFLRNSWNPDLIVVDVTGSMYPFTADLLKWIKLTNDDRMRHYVFFNDGNDKPTNQKKIGQTGGIFHLRSNEFPEIREKVFEAMRAGGGGDLPENNFEALLAGVKEAAPKGDVVMIADNYSFPRDAALLARYTGKLKIILCHTEKGINTDYLNLAKKHGFTLHTMETDLVDLTKAKMNVEGHEYRQEQSGFVRVR